MKEKTFLFRCLSLFILLMSLQKPQLAEAKERHDKQTLDESNHHHKKHCSKHKNKKHQEVTYIIKLPFVIKKSGDYKLTRDLEFNPKPSKFAPPDPLVVQAAIRVKPGVSNVIIDLENHRLSQAGLGTSMQTPYVVGILVPNPNLTNTLIDYVGAQSIYIQGDQAIIDGFSMYGVRIFANTPDIRLSNLTIKNCGVLASKALRQTVNGFPYLTHTNGNPTPITPGFGPSFGVGGLVIGESTALGMGPEFFVETPTNVTYNVNRVNEVVLANVSCLDNFFMGAMTPCITNVPINNL